MFCLGQAESHHLFRAKEPREFVQLIQCVNTLHYGSSFEDLKLSNEHTSPARIMPTAQISTL